MVNNSEYEKMLKELKKRFKAAKTVTEKNKYKNLINNIYFQKSINQIFDNLVPRYKNINHKISSGETFDKILNNYSIPNEEINQIKKKLNSDTIQWPHNYELK